jgi:hypothetical protein
MLMNVQNLQSDPEVLDRFISQKARIGDKEHGHRSYPVVDGKTMKKCTGPDNRARSRFKRFFHL